ncbi:MAG TPA: hypothetical protein VFR58_17880 [Flavisolibacter sp.]|nr:hypothetical protein [Flavisolibacter sp.]
MSNKENTSVNHQDHPHQEGQQNNTPAVKEVNRPRSSDDVNQSVGEPGKGNRQEGNETGEDPNTRPSY